MRSPRSTDEQALYLVREEAQTRRWPSMTVDFRGDGYLTSWGPGVNPWIDVLWRAEGEDLRLLLKVLRAMPVPLDNRDLVVGLGDKLHDGIQRAARNWALIRQKVIEADRLGAPTVEVFDSVVASGAADIIAGVMAKLEVAETLATVWQSAYRRASIDNNAKRETDADAARKPGAT